jgi:pimeloyl-ACP methyl ester carboxylesterase
MTRIQIAAILTILVAAINVPAQSAAAQPLSIARQGYLFAGGAYSDMAKGRVMSGQLYAEFQIPAKQTHPWPVVMVHGLSQTGTNFTGTPDGREGWAQFFLRQGYAVYVVDQPGRGRAAYEPEHYGMVSRLDLDATTKRFVAPEHFNLWPQAHLHTQWPGAGEPGDAAFDQFYASQVPSIENYALPQALNRDAIVALLERIGPAILLTHSQSGGFGWPVADARPDLVKAIIAVEPSGPPFFNTDNIAAPEWFRDAATPARPYGLTAVPLTYNPPLSAPSDLAPVRQDKADGPDLVRCWQQGTPPRQLVKLRGIPILVVTAEASYHAPYDHCTVKYMQQVGLHPTWMKLSEAGLRGNGHMMMLEKNNQDIAQKMAAWVQKSVLPTKH